MPPDCDDRVGSEVPQLPEDTNHHGSEHTVYPLKTIVMLSIPPHPHPPPQAQSTWQYQYIISIKERLDIVEPPQTVSFLKRPPPYNSHYFLSRRTYYPHIDSCLNLFTTAAFFCPQGGLCGEVQLYKSIWRFSSGCFQSSQGVNFLYTLQKKP